MGAILGVREERGVKVGGYSGYLEWGITYEGDFWSIRDGEVWEEGLGHQGRRWGSLGTRGGGYG